MMDHFYVVMRWNGVAWILYYTSMGDQVREDDIRGEALKWGFRLLKFTMPKDPLTAKTAEIECLAEGNSRNKAQGQE